VGRKGIIKNITQENSVLLRVPSQKKKQKNKGRRKKGALKEKGATKIRA